MNGRRRTIAVLGGIVLGLGASALTAPARTTPPLALVLAASKPTYQPGEYIDITRFANLSNSSWMATPVPFGTIRLKVKRNGHPVRATVSRAITLTESPSQTAARFLQAIPPGGELRMAWAPETQAALLEQRSGKAPAFAHYQIAEPGLYALPRPTTTRVGMTAAPSTASASHLTLCPSRDTRERWRTSRIPWVLCLYSARSCSVLFSLPTVAPQYRSMRAASPTPPSAKRSSTM